MKVNYILTLEMKSENHYPDEIVKHSRHYIIDSDDDESINNFPHWYEESFNHMYDEILIDSIKRYLAQKALNK